MPTKKHTILIVDDTPVNINLLKGILSPYYLVKIATRGALALRVADKEPRPDLILLDVMMPDMDGYAVCQQLKSKASTRDIPVIFVTARDQAEDEARGFELGAADYLIKPVSVPVVLARVRTHLTLADERLLLADVVRERTEQLEQLKIELIKQLGRAGEFRDNETSAHTMRMAQFSRLLAERSGIEPVQCEILLHAAMLHDVGKIAVPDAILRKPDKLTAEEFAIIQQHCENGVKIIGTHDTEILRMAREIALSHHERWNGSGYPNGLQGEEIPVLGRIAALADVFDALTSIRPYKRAWPVEEALELIAKEAGAHFDPQLAQLFISLEPELRQIMATYQDE